MQEVKVIARTFEVGTEHDTDQMNKELTVLSGKAAGVCYMPDDYFENGVQDEDKALNRAEMTAKSGHHSVYDHGHITFLIKTNKMMAMILNSLGVYTTSEKSARYTKMQPETDLELELYNKWRDIIQKLILEKYPDTDDTMLNTRLCKKLGVEPVKLVHSGIFCLNKDSSSIIPNEEKLLNANDILDELKKSETLPSYKLAMENARYMISVFTPTTMEYTISFRQAFLTLDYLSKLHIKISDNNDTFSKKLVNYVQEFIEEFRGAIGTEIRLRDNKNQHIRFLEAQYLTTDKPEELEAKKEVIRDSYTLVYEGSLAMLAQAQRHRTLRYTMKLQEPGEIGFYIPAIISNAGLEDEWMEDIQSVAYCIPQGTLVRITEQGIFEDFVLKCKERLCGRAQLEVAKSTEQNLYKFIRNKNELCYFNKRLLDTITQTFETGENKVCARCGFKDFKCTEGCSWGIKGALTRLI